MIIHASIVIISLLSEIVLIYAFFSYNSRPFYVFYVAANTFFHFCNLLSQVMISYIFFKMGKIYLFRFQLPSKNADQEIAAEDAI